MSIKKFEFKKAYEEIEIAGKIYKLDFSDEAILRYQRQFDDFYYEVRKLDELDVTKMTSIEEKEELFNKMFNITKAAIEGILGEGEFEPLYEKSGRSITNVADVITFISEIIGERSRQLNEEKRQRYLNSKKRQQKFNKRKYSSQSKGE